MADKDGLILQLYSRARAPNRDYYGLTISTEEIVLNIWNITHGPHVFPKKQKCPLVDLQIAKTLVSEIQRLFGSHVLDYCLALGRGDARLECLPTKIFLRILRFLAGNDILKLGQTSKIIFELCNRNDVWGIVFAKLNKAKPSRDELKAADQKGWKIVLKNKLVWCDGLHRTKHQKHSTSKSKVVDVNKPPVQISANVVKKPNVKPATEKKEVPIKVQDTDKFKVPQVPVAKVKCTFATKNVNDIASAPNLVEPLFKTPTISTQPKGILKKSGKPFVSKTSTKLLNFAEKIENIPEVPAVVTTIDYTPMARETSSTAVTSRLISKCRRPSLNSLLNGFLSKDDHAEKNSKDRHLDRFLSDLEEKNTLNPFQLNHEPTNNKKLQSSSRNSNQAATRTPYKPKLSSDNMTSKFENYLNSLKGRSVHPSVEISPRTPSQQGKISKSELLPKISELTRSINQMRSNFYNTDKLKIKLSSNLNNSKVENKNGCSQQLNNKLNNVVPASSSTSTLEMKKNNVLRTPSRSAISSIMPKSAKLKNTNCAASAKPHDKPKTNSASKISSRNTTHVKK